MDENLLSSASDTLVDHAVDEVMEEVMEEIDEMQWRSVKEFADPSGFNVPADSSVARERVKTNLPYYCYNYLAIGGVFVALSLYVFLSFHQQED